MSEKKCLGYSVLTAAEHRIRYAFDHFPRLCVSFSGGKDSTVMLHLAMAEAKRRQRKIALLFLDLEAQYKLTIDHIESCFARYAPWIEPFWIALPLNLRNAVSNYEPQWRCWDPERRADWVREPPAIAITDGKVFPFFREGMEFEEFVKAFGAWYGKGKLCGNLVGIRSGESLNRWRAIACETPARFEGCKWTTFKGYGVYTLYPIYDWKTEDLWTYFARTKLPYNPLYDRMWQAGLTIHQMRICQPYGDDQRRGLWLYHLIEPETWGRVVARVNGANCGALYALENGNILGNRNITCPAGHTWQSFAMLLLGSLPPRTQEHFRTKITSFLKWYEERGFPNGIPDEAEPRLETAKKVPSWRRICKALLKNDYWCRSLSFSQHKSASFIRYRKIMKNRMRSWKFPIQP